MFCMYVRIKSIILYRVIRTDLHKLGNLNLNHAHPVPRYTIKVIVK